MENLNDIVPKNTSGKQLSLKHSRTDKSHLEAVKTFKRTAMRLLNPMIWKDLSGTPSASFKQIDTSGQKALRLAEEGDYVRINIPGPGSTSDDGFDWVKIEKLIDHSDPTALMESFAIRVRPSTAPLVKTKKTIHFLTKHASSTFIVERNDTTTTVYYYGRNEDINLDTPNTIDKLRNMAVAIGSFAGLAKMQWNALLKGLLADEIGG